MASSAGANIPAYMLPGVPVFQPPHLEGDASLATEILPGPPPLISIQQPSNSHKKDPKKQGVQSYLPVSDPGTTYIGHALVPAMSATIQEPEGPRRKRARVDKGSAADRAQRAEVRHAHATSSTSDIVATEMSPAPAHDSDEQPMSLDPVDRPALSRSSSFNMDDGSAGGSVSAKGRSTRQDAKGKEKEKPGLKVKEEPQQVSLQSLHDFPSLMPNQDHCSSCHSQGALVYCDGCPRAFHFWCLDPPMEPGELKEGDGNWFCPSCTAQENPPPRVAPSILSPLIQQVQNSLPVEFQLPDDIRGFFKDVATSVRGGYVDSSQIKPPRLNRHGQLEDRDSFRLKDRNGAPVLCFHCGRSALPLDGTSAPAAKRPRRSSTKSHDPETWRSIVSCDYCNLHWHLDCLDPPLLTMPPFGKKWMCPNHIDHVLQPKHRIPKRDAPPIEITKPGQWNNGIVDIIQSEPAPQVQKVPVDEVMINGRRYRVPERVVMLDFWSKISRERAREQRDSGLPSSMSSPLTSLSELDMDDPFEDLPAQQPKMDDMSAARVLCDLQGKGPKASVALNIQKPATNGKVRTDSNQSTSRPRVPLKRAATESSTKKPNEGKMESRPEIKRLKIDPTSVKSKMNGVVKTEQVDVKSERVASTSSGRELRGRPREPTSISNRYPSPATSNLRRSSRVTIPRVRLSSAGSRESITSPDQSTFPTSTPSRVQTPAAPPAKPASPLPAAQTPPTQSLKIRLPRLSSLNLQTNTDAHSTTAPSTNPESNALKRSASDARPRRATRDRR